MNPSCLRASSSVTVVNFTLAEGFNEGAIAEAIVRFLESDRNAEFARKTYERTRGWNVAQCWPGVRGRIQEGC
jgi:hypothetical protein